MTLEISAEKRRLASLTMGWFSASSAALPDAAARFFFGAAEGGCAGEECELEVRVRLAERGGEDAVGIGVEGDGKHGFGERGLDLEGVRRRSVWGEGEGRVVEGVGGGLLAFDGGEGRDEGGLEGVEVEVGLWFGGGREVDDGFDELRAVGSGCAEGSGARAREPVVVEKVEAVVVGRTASRVLRLRAARFAQDDGCVVVAKCRSLHCGAMRLRSR